jgi:hypothetical protein
VARVLVQVFGVLDESLGPARGQKVGLLDEIEERVLRPLGIAEAVVLRVGHGDRLRLFALHALEGADPEAHEIGGEAALRFDRLLRIAHPILGDLAEGLDDVADVVGEPSIAAPLLGRLQVCGRGFAGLLDKAGHVARQGLEIGEGQLGRLVLARLLHGTSRPSRAHSRVFDMLAL